MKKAEPDGQVTQMTLGAAVGNIRHSLASDDIFGAHTSWLWLMNASGEDFALRLAGPNPDHTGAWRASISALVACSALIPDHPDNKAAKAMVDALVALVVEAPTGKREHPLFRGTGWVGTYGKGSLKLQHIIGHSLACVWLLKQLGHRSPDKFVAKVLNDAGHEVTRITLSGWKKRIDGWEVATAVRDDFIARIHADGFLSRDGVHSQSEAIIKAALSQAVATYL